MATKTSRLQLVIAGDNKGAVKAIQGTGKELSGLKGKLGGLGSGLGSALSGAAVIAFGKSAVSSYESQAKAVAQVKRLTGESAENASLLAFAAQQSGIDAAKAATAWGILSKNIVNGKVAAEGINTRGADGQLLGFEEILGNIAERFVELPPGAERTALALKLFGRGGADMGKLLAKGKDGVADLRAEMRKFGVELSDEDLANLGDYVAAQRDFQAAMTGLKNTIGRDALPALTSLAEAGATALPKVVGGLRAFADIIGPLPGPVQAVALGVGGLTLATAGLATAVGILGPPLRAGLASLGAMIPIGGAATATTGALAVATLTEAEAAAAAAAAQQALVASWVAGTPAASAQAAATTTVATANTAAATSGAAAAGSAGLLAKALPIAALALGTKAAVNYAQKLTDAHASQEQLANASEEDRAKLALVYNEFNKGAFVKIGRENVQSLKDMQAAVTELYGEPLPALADAIKTVEKEQEAATGATDENTDASLKNAEALAKQAAEMERIKGAAEARVSRLEGIESAERQWQDAVGNSTDAQAELAEAMRDAEGKGQEYADARQAIADAEVAVGEAQQGVVDAQADLIESQRDLNLEREEASDRLREMAQATRDAALAEADATLKVKEAREEQRRVNADPRSNATEKERAALAVRQAEEEARQAAEDRAEQERDNASAQAAGVEGDKGVVDARKAVADAERKVTDAKGEVVDATRRVGEAEQGAAAVITAAQGRVFEAQKKVADARVGEIQALGDFVEATDGSAESIRKQIEMIDALAGKLRADDPLRQRLGELKRDLQAIFPSADTIDDINAGRPPSQQNVPPARDPDSRGGRSLGLSTINVTNILQGTPTQQRRASANATKQVLDAFARGGR